MISNKDLMSLSFFSFNYLINYITLCSEVNDCNTCILNVYILCIAMKVHREIIDYHKKCHIL